MTQTISTSTLEPDYLHAGDLLERWKLRREQSDNEPGVRFRAFADAAEFVAKRALYSQELFIFAPEKETLAISGIGTGKTVALITKGLLQSHWQPNNYGLILRDTETNLVKTTRKDFHDIAGSLIVRENKGEGITEVRDRKGTLSTIAFAYLRSSVPGRTHLSNYNLGWYAVDQLEDAEAKDWDYLNTRLRRANIDLRLSWAIANPRGQDWIFRRWIEPALKRKWRGAHKTTARPGKLGEPVLIEEWRASKDLYAIRSPTEENIHLPDKFIEGILRNRSKEYIDRYLHGSFDDWGGRVYKGYNYNTVHNIDPFPIPDEWPAFVWIDVGGDAPWAVIVARMDPHYGDVFVVNELYGPDFLPHQIVEWVRSPKSGAMVNGQMPLCVIDPQNKTAVIEFLRYDMMVSAAAKGPKVPGIMHVADYFRPKPGRLKTLPQPSPGGGFENKVFENAPHLWVFKGRAENWRREHAQYQWHRDARTDMPTNRPVDVNDHCCFVAGTKIATRLGAIAVESIRVGDSVVTPRGDRKITATMSRLADVVRVTLSDGRVLSCTPDHPFFTARGYAAVSTLNGRVVATQGELWKTLWKLRQCALGRKTKSSSSAGIATTSAVSIGSATRQGRGSIETSGRRTTGRSQAASMFTTLTMTARTIIAKTCNCFTALSTCPAIWTTPSESPLPSGMLSIKQFPQPCSGGRTTLSERLRSRQKPLPLPLLPSLPTFLSTFAFNAGYDSRARQPNGKADRKNNRMARFAVLIARPLIVGREALTILTKPVLFAATAIGQTASNLLGLVRVVAVEECGRSRVFNITVDDAHCYYADGALVSNCDATLYGLKLCPPIEELPETNPDIEFLKKYDRINYRAVMDAVGREKEDNPLKHWMEFSQEEISNTDWDKINKHLRGEDETWMM